MPILQKMLLTVLAIALLPVLLVGGVFYLNSQSMLQRQVFNHLSSTASIQQDRVNNLIKQNNERLESFTSRLQMRISLERYNRLATAADQAFIQQIIAEAQTHAPTFKTISVLNPEGQVIASSRPTTVGKAYGSRSLVTTGLKGQDVTSNPFVGADNMLMIYLVGPLKLNNKLVGVAVIESDASDLLAITKDHAGLGETGETILVQRDSDGNALHLTPLRFDSHATLTRVESKNDGSRPAIRALAGQEGTWTDTSDYRNQPVLAATRKIENANWGLIVKIDRAEAEKPLLQLGDLLLVLLFVISVVVIFVSFSLAHRLNEPLLALASAAAKIRAGDLSQRAVISTNDETGQLASTFNDMARNFEKIDQMKSEFVLLTSHQLRTPATAVKGFLSMLLDGYAGKVTAGQKKLIDVAYAENERQISVINSILDVAKLEAGEMTLMPAVHDIVQIAKASALSQEPLARGQHQKIEVLKPKTPVKLWVDGEKLQLVIDNLIHNAIKYSAPNTTITVNIEQQPEFTSIEVRDQGIGIARKDIPQLFKRFSRIATPQTVNVQGAGLGLYLASRLIEMHGGAIRIESEIGKGSTFIIELPSITKGEN